ncbi:MAG: class I SAM-dependent RNA methyltransferase [Fibrobacteria bacterium]
MQQPSQPIGNSGRGPSRELEITIEKLVPGGEGMARHDGKVIFVPMVLPGETVRVRLTESKQDFARGIAVEILAPSPDRALPGCSVFGRCGGCDWQHISYEAQLRFKVAIVKDALKRTGGLEFPGLAIEAGKPWRYRNRIQVHRGPSGQGGFRARTSHDVVGVSTCPVSAEAFDRLFPRPVPAGTGAGQPSAEGAGPIRRSEAAGPEVGDRPRRDARDPDRKDRTDHEGRRFSAWTHTLPDGGERFLISQEPGLTGPGLLLPPAADASDRGGATNPGLEEHHPSRPVPEYLGPRVQGTEGVITAPVLGKTIRFDLRCFFQSNLEMTEKLIPYALDGLSGEEALDLYCGVGLFGAFLKDRFARVLAVEENPISLEYALGNIGDTQHFLRGRVEDLIREERGPLASGRPDAVVVDPPRDGLDAAVRDYLIVKRPPKLVYVSCNPVTLARDLKILLAAGFVLDDLRLFDFYPQTAHVESVAKLSFAAGAR